MKTEVSRGREQRSRTPSLTREGSLAALPPVLSHHLPELLCQGHTHPFGPSCSQLCSQKTNSKSCRALSFLKASL